ncbi:barnase inhibitor [Parasulfuritortus cantonensis]|uniref:Barnase inhibitor n=1 Tax=Parasulfuritortus cantonensis TaxID=2528202 RepID=A0A4R1BA82_9PROT|nr:barstar family protein [Parasulfuritortus cantonensis]TCJ13861.1 barnase inhibitor [Parasulfuritortus cantonensis]
MSGLAIADVLGHPQHNGIYRLAPGATLPAGLIHLAGRRLTGKPAMLEAVAEAFACPDYFGANWDALEDSLGDLSWLAGPIGLVIEAADLPAAAAPDSWPVLLDILGDVSRSWRGAGRPFAVFLRGGHDAYPLIAG